MKIDINKRYAWDSGTFKREAIIHSVNGPVDRFPIIASTKTISGNWETAAHSLEGFIEVREPREWQIWIHPQGGTQRHEPLCMGWEGPIRVREIID